jgi:hypothetical protein
MDTVEGSTNPSQDKEDFEKEVEEDDEEETDETFGSAGSGGGIPSDRWPPVRERT